MTDHLDLSGYKQESLDAFVEFCVTTSRATPAQLRQALEAGANPDHLFFYDQLNTRHSALQHCALTLIRHGTSLEPLGNEGTLHDKAEKFNLLLRYGANPNRLPGSQIIPPIYLIMDMLSLTANSRQDIVKQLLNLGAYITPECLKLSPEPHTPLQGRVQQAGTVQTIMQPSPEPPRPIEYLHLCHLSATTKYTAWQQHHNVTTLTRDDIIAFANLNHHREVFDPALWRDHQHQCAALLSSLPQWMTHDIIQHQPGLLSSDTPSCMVSACSSAALSPLPPRGRI